VKCESHKFGMTISRFNFIKPNTFLSHTHKHTYPHTHTNSIYYFYKINEEDKDKFLTGSVTECSYVISTQLFLLTNVPLLLLSLALYFPSLFVIPNSVLKFKRTSHFEVLRELLTLTKITSSKNKSKKKYFDYLVIIIQCSVTFGSSKH